MGQSGQGCGRRGKLLNGDIRLLPNQVGISLGEDERQFGAGADATIGQGNVRYGELSAATR